MSLTNEQLNKVTEAILGGNKIVAIKVYREATGLGLAEAKTEIERLSLELAKDHPELLQAQKKGCATVIVAGIFIATVLATAALGSYSSL